MMWQDMIFMIGSGLSIFFLAPTLRDAAARVPLGTSIPSMAIGVVYGVTFATMDMTFSALGALAAGSMWALIAVFRSPGRQSPTLTRTDGIVLFVQDCRRWSDRVIGGNDPLTQFEADSTRQSGYAHATTGQQHGSRFGTSHADD
ncbi:hypothetical protein ACLI4Y_02355 [Natrialbaceae archaeon A-CW3]